MEQTGLETAAVRRKMIHTYRGTAPRIDPSAFIAESAQIIGDVVIGKASSVWFNAVIRGDVNYIHIGERTNIQDGCLLHVRHEKYPLLVGNDVTVGHGAILHGCTIDDCCLIGMGSVVLDNAKIAHHTLIAAGAVVREGAEIPPEVLVAGVPAKVVRPLTEEEKRMLEQSAKNYLEFVKSYR